jgi:hypothetical protein
LRRRATLTTTDHRQTHFKTTTAVTPQNKSEPCFRLVASVAAVVRTMNLRKSQRLWKGLSSA